MPVALFVYTCTGLRPVGTHLLIGITHKDPEGLKENMS